MNPTLSSSGPWIVAGTMSGTSLDGLDICVARFARDGATWSHELLSAETIPYNRQWAVQLSTAHTLCEPELQKLDQDYSRYIGEAVKNHLNKLPLPRVDLIGSHGHTVFHRPETGLTRQIGNLHDLRDAAGIPTVCDFRVQDVQLGGQGAPLVPIGDELLYGTYDACINFGGFSNISRPSADGRRAWDISPLNIVLNPLAQKLGYPYDNHGKLARSGRLIASLLEQLEATPYYAAKPPKSLGREWVELQVDPLFRDVAPRDALRTCTEHFVRRIAKETENLGSVLCTGGGVYNTFLMDLLRERSAADFVIPSREEVDFKEALVFALLGLLRFMGEINVRASVTGASGDHSSGVIYL